MNIEIGISSVNVHVVPKDKIEIDLNKFDRIGTMLPSSYRMNCSAIVYGSNSHDMSISSASDESSHLWGV